MITKKFVTIIISLGLYGLNSDAMDLANQKQGKEFADQTECELLVKDTEERLAKIDDKQEREILIDATTHFFAQEARYAPTLALWLKRSGKPNNTASISKVSPLFEAMQACNIEGMKVLLADPRTIINRNELFLQVVIANGSAEIDQTKKNKKILRLLLFFGIDPNAKIGKNLTGQESADAFESYDPEYSHITKNYKNIAAVMSPDEFREFDTIMKLRNFRHHRALIHREIGGRPAKMGKKLLLPKADHPQQAAAAAGAGQASQVPVVRFNWPKIDDTKNNT